MVGKEKGRQKGRGEKTTWKRYGARTFGVSPTVEGWGRNQKKKGKGVCSRYPAKEGRGDLGERGTISPFLKGQDNKEVGGRRKRRRKVCCEGRMKEERLNRQIRGNHLLWMRVVKPGGATKGKRPTAC